MINKTNKLCNVLDSGMCYGKGISTARGGVFLWRGDVKKSGLAGQGKATFKH